MRIKKVKLEKYHGFIDLDLSFNDDMTVIVGRNGSGKTTTLNIITDLLKFDFRSLRKTIFSLIEIELFDDVYKDIKIFVSNTEESQKVGITFSGEIIEIPLETAYLIDLKGDALSHRKSIFNDMFFHLSRNSHEKNLNFPAEKLLQWSSVLSKISSLAKLTFVRLDRTIVALDSSGALRADLPRNITREVVSSDPIDEVLRVTTERYGEYKQEIEEIKEDAFGKLLKLNFDPVEQVSVSNSPSTTELKRKINQLKRRVERSTIFSESPELKEYTASFFESFKDLVFEKTSTTKKAGRRSLQEESVQILINLKERQIEKLLEIFESEQEKAQVAYEKIKIYLDTCTKFIKESGKTLDFNTSLQLGFSVASAPDKDLRSLKELASGERQILIVLTYLAFIAGEDSIFIIDEPELSLHLRWQGYLVEALQNLRPKGCQIIIATHAPEIAGRARSSIKILSPKHLPSETL